METFSDREARIFAETVEETIQQLTKYAETMGVDVTEAMRQRFQKVAEEMIGEAFA